MMSRRRKRARKAIAMREIAAAFASLLLPQAERDALRAAKAPAKKLISLFTPDHVILHALDGADRWWNLTMTRRGPELKAKDNRDTSIVAKVRRLEPQHEEFRRKVLARPPGRKRERTGNWPQGRKLQSKGFERRQ